MKTLVTGSAGFIGSQLSIRLLEMGLNVIGVDNHNDYYDTRLKSSRVNRHLTNPNYVHIEADISNAAEMHRIFRDYEPRQVVNLAAQAGVRYSIENPHAYIESNISGFMNILECCRLHQIEHLVYASSSSVYGANSSMPFAVHDNVDHPLSIYAATKKSNELMAHSYSHLFNLPTTGLRFFTVYGPWGRPDMALFKFAKAIIDNEPLPIYNYGKHLRDFTYIDDIVEGIITILKRPASGDEDWKSEHPTPGSSSAPWRIYNIGNNKPVELMHFVKALEASLGKKAEVKLLPLQLGDVPDTYADVTELVNDFGYRPRTSVEEGIKHFVKWYLEYYEV